MSDRKLTRNELHQREMRRLLAKGAPRAIARLVSLLDSENEAVAKDAAKAILDYQIAKPKEAPTLTVNLTQTNHAAHLASLAARVVQETTGQNVNALISHDNLAARGKLPINRAPIIDANAVPVTADNAVTADKRDIV